MQIFKDRQEAGKLLAKELAELKGNNDLIVFALPRGGVPIALEIAKELVAPLDVFLVRKIGTPQQEELALGAVAIGGIKFLNEELVKELSITKSQLDAIIKHESEEIERRNLLYRNNQPMPNLKNKTVIIVDDGVATGATLMVAIKAIKLLGCKNIIVAIPVAPPDTYATLSKEVNKIYCLETPILFGAIGQFYLDFTQLEDDDVIELLKQAKELPTSK